MLKKLLVAVLVLTIFIGLFSPALATKNPTDADRFPVSQMADKGTRGYPCATEEYDAAVQYIYTWKSPDKYGDNYWNERFTNAAQCSLKTIYMAFYPTSGRAPGATIFVSHSNGLGFPDFTPGSPHLNDVCASIPILVVTDYYPNWTTVDLTLIPGGAPAQFTGDFNVGYSTIKNDPRDSLKIVSDDYQNPQARSSSYSTTPYPADWMLMVDDWGYDFNFFIAVDKCCYSPACDPGPLATDQWPIWCHDFGRSSQSGITLGTDICGIALAWKYDIGMVGVGGTLLRIERTTPLIVNDLVYVFYTDRVVCLYLNGPLAGTVKWSSKTFTGAAPWDWGPAIGTIWSDPAIVDGNLYMGTGAVAGSAGGGFIKVDAATGAKVWARGTFWGTPLPSPGATQYAPPVIIGNKVFFGNSVGSLYGLDIATGASTNFGNLKVVPGGANAIMAGSLSSDGTNLFVGTGNSPTVPTLGCVYSLLPQVTPLTGFTENWHYLPPPAVQAAYPGGFTSAPSYRCENLFIHPNTVYNLITGNSCGGTGYCGYRQDLDPLTGIEKWASYYVQGAAYASPPATMGTPTGVRAVFANITTGGCQSSGVSTRGIRAVNATTNTTMWGNYGVYGLNNMVYCAASVTQDPWVFYGTADPYGMNLRNKYGGNWIITNGTTGAITVSYALTGYLNGTAIAHGTDDGSGFGNNWIVVTCQRSEHLLGSGQVYAFRDKGPRPRMVIPSTVVTLDPVQQSDPIPVGKTVPAAIKNSGCMPLTYTLGALSDVPLLGAQTPALAKGNGTSVEISTVSSASKMRADNLANSLIDQRVEDLSPMGESVKDSKFFNDQSPVLDDEYVPAGRVKPAIANSSRLGIPAWVTLTSATPNPIPGGGSATLTFDFYRNQMAFLVTNTFYVDITASNDPDYNIDDTTHHVLSEIQVDVPYVYCAAQTGNMRFGDTGNEFYSNNGVFGDGGPGLDFSLNGSDDYLYAGTMFFMTSMSSAAWNPQGSSVPAGLSFLMPFMVGPGNCGGCGTDATLPVAYTPDGGSSYAWVHGDTCSFAVIDTGQAFGVWPHQTGPSMGILVKYREIGAYGPDFGDFKLVVADITNRNAGTLTGLYYGNYADWDVGSGMNNGNGNVSNGIVYENDGAIVRGFIGLPLKGSYFNGVTPTNPMYNALIMANNAWVYPSATCPECLLDSLYAGVNARPQGAVSYVGAASPGGTPLDAAIEVAFGKVNLAGGATKTYGFAMWGSNAAPTPLVDMDIRAKFINKFAGFGRGDVNNDGVINLGDVVRLARWVAGVPGALGPVPFRHLGDVNNDTVVNSADVIYLAAYFFTGGPAPKSAFMF